ncbi:hypothetical protein M9Y10_038407 [Tritrichomonas musculus]|uniref:Uncharacterized protein n=1 Tax=Tritrichomonas musculus TaxID=1915356 RepID=A0ABR2K8X2_9EUKA
MSNLTPLGSFQCICSTNFRDVNDDCSGKVFIHDSFVRNIFISNHDISVLLCRVHNKRNNLEAYTGTLAGDSSLLVKNASLPNWLMEYLELEEGDEVIIDYLKSLPPRYKWSFDLMPLDPEFIDEITTNYALDNYIRFYPFLMNDVTIELPSEKQKGKKFKVKFVNMKAMIQPDTYTHVDMVYTLDTSSVMSRIITNIPLTHCWKEEDEDFTTGMPKYSTLETRKEERQKKKT